VITGSLVLTNLSTEHLIGLNGDAFNHTIAVTAWETTAALAMVLPALYFLPRYLKSGFTTTPQFLADRYDQQTRIIATLLFLFSYVAAILPVVLLFGASGIESLFEVSANLGLILIGEGNLWSGLSEVYGEANHKFDITGDEPGSFMPFGVLFTGMVEHLPCSLRGQIPAIVSGRIARHNP
jgi:SSS family solute:Na+ symporter